MRLLSCIQAEKSVFSTLACKNRRMSRNGLIADILKWRAFFSDRIYRDRDTRYKVQIRFHIPTSCAVYIGKWQPFYLTFHTIDTTGRWIPFCCQWVIIYSLVKFALNENRNATVCSYYTCEIRRDVGEQLDVVDCPLRFQTNCCHLIGRRPAPIEWCWNNWHDVVV